MNEKGDVVMDEDNEAAIAYGWDYCVLLAKKSNILARRNPENFSYFAAAMYWSDYAWGTGSAKKVKSK